MGLFSDFINACIDTTCAPSGLSDPCSDVHSHATANSNESDWHSNYGTQADYQIPAESGNAFESNDWSTGCDFGSSDF